MRFACNVRKIYALFGHSPSDAASNKGSVEVSKIGSFDVSKVAGHLPEACIFWARSLMVCCCMVSCWSVVCWEFIVNWECVVCLYLEATCNQPHSMLSTQAFVEILQEVASSSSGRRAYVRLFAKFERAQAATSSKQHCKKSDSEISQSERCNCVEYSKTSKGAL